MNWVGGARSRVKAKDSLKKQREFFEKRRFQNSLAAGYHTTADSQVSANGTPIAANNNVPKTDLSNDMIFLRTLMKQTAKPVNKNTPQVVHVNMERVRNCSTHVELPQSPEIDCPMTLFHSSKRLQTPVEDINEDKRPIRIDQVNKEQISPSHVAWDPPAADNAPPMNILSTPSREILMFEDSPKNDEPDQPRSVQSDTDSESIGCDNYPISENRSSFFLASDISMSPFEKYAPSFNFDDNDDPKAMKPYTTPGNLQKKFVPISKSPYYLKDAATQTVIKSHEISTQTN